MKPKFTLTTDFKNFKYGLIELKARLQQTSKSAVRAAIKQHMNDCLTKVPKCPRDTNKLADGHHILPVMHLGSQYIGTMHVPGPYAASLHEGISRHGTKYTFKHRPDEGAKWIESKMIAFGDNYVRIAARELSVGLSGTY